MVLKRTIGLASWGYILATVFVSVVLCAGQGLAYTQGDPEYRALWVDCIHPGLLTQAEVDKLLGVPGDPNSIGDIRAANCNTVVAEVRRAGAVVYDSALDEPWLTSGNFDALTAVLNAAHDTTGGKKRIEVHAWIVTFLTGGGTIWNAHRDVNNPDNYWPTLTDTGATADSAWDPGHPKVQKYIVDVMMDLVNNFDVDGVHYDYIRYTGGNQGYNPTSIARYNARYGTTGQPSPTDDLFDQWRRDQITGIVRQVYARIQSTKPQVLQSGSFVTWNPSPAASTRAAFQATRPYGNRSDGVFSDWDAWMQEGIMDIGIPMNYYDDSGPYPDDYDRWLDFIKDRGFNRHMVNGPGLYKNWLDNGDVINQLLITREPSPSGNYCDGFCGFSYWAPYVITKPTGYGTWPLFAPVLKAQVTSQWADVPDRPWKSSPTKGHISGSVTRDVDTWADGATVTVTGPEDRTITCDGTGFYAFIDLTPGTYTLTASLSGYADATRQVNVQIGSVTGNMYVTDILLGGITELVISNVGSSGVTNNAAVITWDTNLPATSQVEYGLTSSYGSATVVNPTEVTLHSQTLTGLIPSTLYHYRVRSGNAGGPKYSADYTFTTNGPPTISNVAAGALTTTSATITWNTVAPSDSRVNYGSTAGYGLSTTSAANTTSHSIVLTDLAPSTLYHFQCVSTNIYGSDATMDYTFTTAEQLNEVVVDNTDPGWVSTGTGAWTPGSAVGVPKIGSNYVYYAGQTIPTRKCTWTPFLTAEGYYDVYVFYQKGTNRNTAAPYTVYYDGGQLTSVQNQYSDIPSQGDWFLIAQDKPFLAGSAGYVELTNQSTDAKYVSADAARWVFKAPFDTTPPTINSVVVSPAMAAVGDHVHVVVDASDATAVESVTANSTPLVKSTESIWLGDISAVGPAGVHGLTVVASDSVGNSTTDSSATYKTARIFGTLSTAAWQPIMSSARGLYLFKFWGKVTEIDDDSFNLTDGSASAITIHAPGYRAKVLGGDCASARGILNIAGEIESELELITKY